MARDWRVAGDRGSFHAYTPYPQPGARVGVAAPADRTPARRPRAAAGQARLLRDAACVPPRLDGSRIGSLCTVVDPAHYQDAEWLSLHHDLERYSIDKHCFQGASGAIYRKGWEWTHCLFGLRRLGMLAHGHRALGVGRECVIFYLAEHIARVTATDLYGEAAWSEERGKEADLALLEESKRSCPPGVDLSRIVFDN